MLGNTGKFGVVRNDTLYRSWGEAEAFSVTIAGLGATIAYKQRFSGVGARVKVGGYTFGSFGTDKDRSVFLAFTAHHELATVEVDVVPVQSNKFADTQAARVQ